MPKLRRAAINTECGISSSTFKNTMGLVEVLNFDKIQRKIFYLDSNIGDKTKVYN